MGSQLRVEAAGLERLLSPCRRRRLGHRSIRTTADIYGSLPESVDRGVADKLDDHLFGNRGLAADRASESQERRVQPPLLTSDPPVEVSGLEPPTSALRTLRSAN